MNKIQIAFFGGIEKKGFNAFLLRSQHSFGNKSSVSFEGWIMIVCLLNVLVGEIDQDARLKALKVIQTRFLGSEGGIVRSKLMFFDKIHRDFIPRLVNEVRSEQARIDKSKFFLNSIGMDVEMLRFQFRNR